MTNTDPSLGGEKKIDTSSKEPQLSGDEAILHYVEMLEHEDADVRERAIFKLAELGDERAIEGLIGLLEYSSGERYSRISQANCEVW